MFEKFEEWARRLPMVLTGLAWIAILAICLWYSELRVFGVPAGVATIFGGIAVFQVEKNDKLRTQFRLLKKNLEDLADRVAPTAQALDKTKHERAENELKLKHAHGALQSLHAHVQAGNFKTSAQVLEALEFLLERLEWPVQFANRDMRELWAGRLRTLIVRRTAPHGRCSALVNLGEYQGDGYCLTCGARLTWRGVVHQVQVCRDCRTAAPVTAS